MHHISLKAHGKKTIKSVTTECKVSKTSTYQTNPRIHHVQGDKLNKVANQPSQVLSTQTNIVWGARQGLIYRRYICKHICTYLHSTFTPWGRIIGTSFLLCASFLILDRNWWIFSHTGTLRKVYATIPCISFWHALRILRNNQIETINTKR